MDTSYQSALLTLQSMIVNWQRLENQIIENSDQCHRTVVSTICFNQGNGHCEREKCPFMDRFYNGNCILTGLRELLYKVKSIVDDELVPEYKLEMVTPAGVIQSKKCSDLMEMQALAQKVADLFEMPVQVIDE